eukprot:1490819-Lingulodinium_polyedra.AAC.1
MRSSRAVSSSTGKSVSRARPNPYSSALFLRSFWAEGRPQRHCLALAPLRRSGSSVAKGGRGVQP